MRRLVILLLCVCVLVAKGTFVDVAKVVANGITAEPLRTLLVNTEPFAADDTLKGRLALAFYERAVVHHVRPTCKAFALAAGDVLDHMRVFKQPYAPPASLPDYAAQCVGAPPVDSNSQSVLRLARSVLTHD
jgi:hypothetical protein